MGGCSSTSPQGKRSGNSCLSCVGKVRQSVRQKVGRELSHILIKAWGGAVVAGWEFFSGVFFYVPGKRHFPKLKMSFPINGGVWVLPAVEVAVMQGLCEDMSVCKAESAQQRVSQRRSGWPITSVSDEKVPPACLYRCAGTWCARHGDGWSPPLHHMAALARAAAPWRGSCGCKWVILCWLIVLSFSNSFKVTWIRSPAWVGLRALLGPALRGRDSLHGDDLIQQEWPCVLENDHPNLLLQIPYCFTADYFLF